MQLKLDKKPKNVTIIEGFPGFGLVGTIATEYLIQHLDCEQIGIAWFEELTPTMALHEGKIVPPIGIYYHKKLNLVVIHAIISTAGVEWRIAKMINSIATDLNAKEVICLEGVGGADEKEKPQTFFFTTSEATKKKLDKVSQQLNEGVIMGVSAAMILKTNLTLTSLFADTHSQLPDSNAAASLLELLDKYIGIGIDPISLHDMAKKFEDKLKTILEQSQTAQSELRKKQLSYVG